MLLFMLLFMLPFKEAVVTSPSTSSVFIHIHTTHLVLLGKPPLNFFT